MFKQIKKLREKEEGFTLIELLVVIAILGILAGVVVFAVQGLGDKGQTNACKIDTRTIKTAEEAHFSVWGTYADEALLVSHTGTPPGATVATTTKFLDALSSLHDVTAVAGPPPSYNLVIGAGGDGKCGGAAGAAVDGTTTF